MPGNPQNFKEITHNAAKKFDKKKLGYDPHKIAQQILDILKSKVKQEPSGLFSISCSFNNLTSEHRKNIEQIMHTVPLVYGANPGKVFPKDFSLDIASPSPTMCEQYIDLLTCYVACEREFGQEIAQNPLWLTKPEHINYCIAITYLLIRAFDSALIYNETQSKITTIAQELNALNIPGKKDLTAAEQKELREKIIRMSTLADIPSLFADTEQLHKDLSHALNLCNRQQSKIAELENKLVSKEAAQRLAASNIEKKVVYLEQQIEEKNKQLAGLARIEELERRLDEANTHIQMLEAMRKLEHEKSKAIVPSISNPSTKPLDIDLDNMRVVMVGGNPNFLNKLRQRFPSWIMGNDLTRSRPLKTDLVLYNYLHCGHNQYNYGRQLAIQTGALEIYVENTNINKFEEEVRQKVSEILSE